jgi:HK97 gp10 family phage protein
MGKVTFDLSGIEELEKKVNSLLSTVYSQDVEAVLMEGAKIIRDEAKSRAQGLYQKQTGKLFKSFRAKKLKRRGRTFAVVIAAVDRSPKTGAPHAQLLEGGHKMWLWGKPTARRIEGRPFFEPAVVAKQAEVQAVVTTGFKRLLMKGW